MVFSAFNFQESIHISCPINIKKGAQFGIVIITIDGHNNIISRTCVIRPIHLQIACTRTKIKNNVINIIILMVRELEVYIIIRIVCDILLGDCHS